MADDPNNKSSDLLRGTEMLRHSNTLKVWGVAFAMVVLSACATKSDKDTAGPAPTATAPAQDQGIVQENVNKGPEPGSPEDFAVAAGNTIYFGFDKYDLSGDAQAVLRRQAEWLNTYGNLSVTVEGHCDERGTREYNLALGERRATAVKNYLVALGVNGSRIQTISYGKERPAVLGSDEAAWAKNRRGVTVIN
jgi:peptidoglycan-associated lipoprotein